jgi:hypothetical protein
MDYHFLLFLIDSLRRGGVILSLRESDTPSGQPGTDALLRMTTELIDMAKRQGGRGAKEVNPFDAVDLVEREGDLYLLTRAEVVGKAIRAKVREIVKAHDPKGFLTYKDMKHETKTRDEKAEAYEHLLFRFFNHTAQKHDADTALRLAIVDLAMCNPSFEQAELKTLDDSESLVYIIKNFLDATYTIPNL